MIKLHRLDNKEFIVNADLIKYIEATPDTLLTLLHNDSKIIVKENIDDIIRLTTEYKQACCSLNREKK